MKIIDRNVKVDKKTRETTWKYLWTNSSMDKQKD